MKKRLLSFILAGFAYAGVTPSHALTIALVDLGGTAPTAVAGGNTLPVLMQAAADVWEAAYTTSHTLTISYEWGVKTGGTLASHSLTGQGGVPSRETSATLTFDNDNSTRWFMDLTPFDSSEFGTLSTSSADLGGGVMNTGRRYDGGYTGPLVGGFTPHDLFSTAVHEIGHALGLSSANVQYQTEAWPDNDIDVIAPRPFAGATILTNNSGAPVPPATSNAHFPSASYPLALMCTPCAVAGTRRTPTALDVVANAELQDFDIGSLDPYAAVPEPSTSLLMIGGIALFLGRRRRS